jgi:spermidine synthase
MEYFGSRNKHSVWTGPTAQFSESHFRSVSEMANQTMHPGRGTRREAVLDPFGGSGTTLKVAQEHNRECTIIEIGPKYVEIAKRRTAIIQPVLNL